MKILKYFCLALSLMALSTQASFAAISSKKLSLKSKQGLFKTSTSTRRLMTTTGRGSSVEYVKLILKSNGSSIRANGRIQVLMYQYQGKNKWNKKQGWMSLKGVRNLPSYGPSSSVSNSPSKKLETRYICPEVKGQKVKGYNLKSNRVRRSFNQGEKVKINMTKGLYKREFNRKTVYVANVEFKNHTYVIKESDLVESKRRCSPSKREGSGVSFSRKKKKETRNSSKETKKSRKNSSKSTKSTKVKKGLLDKVVCLSSGSANVHRKLPRKGVNSRPFKARNKSSIKVFPGKAKPGYIRGKKYQFLKVQISSSGRTGYIADSLVKTSSECSKKRKSTSNYVEKRGNGKEFFPMYKRPHNNYNSRAGFAYYGAFRSKRTRAHAGVDLYSGVGRPLRAMWDGRVIRGGYTFYCHTSAFEVKFKNGKIGRYGETQYRPIYRSKNLKAGDPIAKVGKLSCYHQPMLHFELYSGKLGTGGLSAPRKSSKHLKAPNGRMLPTGRRRDLMNPAPSFDRLLRKL